MLVQKFGIGSTNYPQFDIFIYSHHVYGSYCIDTVRRNSVLVTHGSQSVQCDVFNMYFFLWTSYFSIYLLPADI